MAKTVTADQDAAFEAIVAADTLQAFLDTLSPLVDEAKLHCHADGLGARAVDPANVGMVDSHLAPAAFGSYSAGDVTLGVNVTRLDDVLGIANAGDLVHLELDEASRRLDIRIGGLSYTLALIDPDAIRQEPDIPDLSEDLSAEITLEGHHLDRGATAADLVSDHVLFVADPEAEEFRIEAEGDTDDVEVAVSNADCIHADVPEPTSTLFSLDYVNDMLDPVGDDTEVRVRLGAEYPVKWHYEYADGAGQVTNMLAPRIKPE